MLSMMDDEKESGFEVVIEEIFSGIRMGQGTRPIGYEAIGIVDRICSAMIVFQV